MNAINEVAQLSILDKLLDRILIQSRRRLC